MLSRLRHSFAHAYYRFTEEGEVLVSVRTEVPVPEQSDPAVRTIVVDVRDTGIGIPAAVHSKIFQPFSQGTPSIS